MPHDPISIRSGSSGFAVLHHEDRSKTMSTPDHYEVLVIGSGPGGQRAAIQAAKLARRPDGSGESWGQSSS
jgi:alkyl hydroperoxide reductase subunit AhpF